MNSTPSPNFAYLAHHDARLVALATHADEHFGNDLSVTLINCGSSARCSPSAAAKVGLFATRRFISFAWRVLFPSEASATTRSCSLPGKEPVLSAHRDESELALGDAAVARSSRYACPMADPARRHATYEDLRAVPPHLVAEIIHGAIVSQPRPAAPHARAASRLGVDLGGPFDRGKDGPGGWILLDEPELHLRGGHVLVPDLAGWRRERMPRLPLEVSAFELPPDWVCEVPSPSTEATDRADKMPIYADVGVAHVWLVDPLVRTLEVHRLDGETYRVVGVWRDAQPVRAEPFDAIELELAALWAD